jgi:hypothetical protein
MALFHESVQIISRSKGRSAVACASYRSAEKLYDQRYERTHDYTRRERVLEAFILAPEGAPEWARNRERLWNEVEAKEKRKDSQLAREFNIALPHELSPEQRKALIVEYVTKEFVSRGMVADVAIHEAPRGGDARNHHAHVMLTMRDIGPEGFTKKNLEWNQRAFLWRARDEWAQEANRHLERAGHEQRIDHRSLEAQRQEALQRGDFERAKELARAPQPKLGIGQHIEARPGERSYVREDQRQQRTVELAVFREARKEATELIAVLRGTGLDEVERRFAAEARVLEEQFKEQMKGAEQVEKKLEAMGRSMSIERTGETIKKAPEKSEPQRQQDPFERARTDRTFFEQSQKQVSKEWEAVYQRTMKIVGREVSQQQAKDRQEVEKWWRGRSERIGESIEAARAILEENQKLHGEFSRQARGNADAIRRFERERASLDEEHNERLKSIEGRSGLDKIDRLAQARIKEEHPELMRRLETLHEIGEEWREGGKRKEEKRQLELARTDRGVYERLDKQVKAEWAKALEKCEAKAVEHIVEGQKPDQKRLAEIADAIGGCEMTLGLVAERQKKLFVSREKRKALAADAEQTKADQKRYTNEHQQLSDRLEAEKSPVNVMQEAAHIASVENPELVKRWFALKEIGQEWQQRDRELEAKRVVEIKSPERAREVGKDKSIKPEKDKTRERKPERDIDLEL